MLETTQAGQDERTEEILLRVTDTRQAATLSSAELMTQETISKHSGRLLVRMKTLRGDLQKRWDHRPIEMPPWPPAPP